MNLVEKKMMKYLQVYTPSLPEMKPRQLLQFTILARFVVDTFLSDVIVVVNKQLHVMYHKLEVLISNTCTAIPPHDAPFQKR